MTAPGFIPRLTALHQLDRSPLNDLPAVWSDEDRHSSHARERLVGDQEGAVPQLTVPAASYALADRAVLVDPDSLAGAKSTNMPANLNVVGMRRRVLSTT